MAGYREFQTGEVLTAANVNDFLMNQSVMVFADSAARNTALGTAVGGGNALVEGMLTYNKDTGALEVYDGSAWSGVGGAAKKVAAFTSSGTWTVPAGVTYAIAHVLGGGGGVGISIGGDGGTSSVALSSTISSLGGKGFDFADLSAGYSAVAAQANSGRGALMRGFWNGGRGSLNTGPSDAQWVVGGGTVTPAASVTVTVGAGGSAGSSGAAGGSGYVWIEYYE